MILFLSGSVKERRINGSFTVAISLDCPYYKIMDLHKNNYWKLSWFQNLLYSVFMYIDFSLALRLGRNKTLFSQKMKVSEKTGLQLILSFRCEWKKKAGELYMKERTAREIIIYHMSGIIADNVFHLIYTVILSNTYYHA